MKIVNQFNGDTIYMYIGAEPITGFLFNQYLLK